MILRPRLLLDILDLQEICLCKLDRWELELNMALIFRGWGMLVRGWEDGEVIIQFIGLCSVSINCIQEGLKIELTTKLSKAYESGLM